MPSPFPGMDPYLEHPALWPDLHLTLILALRETLTPVLRPRYYVAVEAREYVAEPAKPEQVREAYLEVRDSQSHQVVTVVEILSPTNKRRGEGREAYLEKRMHVLNSRTNLVEIDLLRGGDRMPAWPHGRPSTDPIPGDYRVLVSRASRRPQADLYPFTVRDSIPAFPLPLRPDDDEPRVDLQALLRELYDRAAYDLRLDYRTEAVPPLRDEDAVWAGDLLRRHNLR